MWNTIVFRMLISSNNQYDSDFNVLSKNILLQKSHSYLITRFNNIKLIIFNVFKSTRYQNQINQLALADKTFSPIILGVS